MSTKKITAGEIPVVSAIQSKKYQFWSLSNQDNMYHGTFGYSPGVDTNRPLSVTLETPKYLKGLKACSNVDDNVTLLVGNNITNKTQATHYKAPIEGTLNGSSVLGLSGSNFELSLDGPGTVSLGDYDASSGKHHDNELSDYDVRYRLSCGVNEDTAREVVLTVPKVSKFMGLNPINSCLGYENGISITTGRVGLENLQGEVVIHKDNPIYFYTKSSTLPLPSNKEIGNTPEGNTKLLIRSNTTNNSTVITDSSFRPRVITHSGVEHTTDKKIFGTSSLRFLNKDSYIDTVNDDDSIITYGDFTLRTTLRTDDLGEGKSCRLFYFNAENYLDLKDLCSISGKICGNVVEGCDPLGDWSTWTSLCIMRVGVTVCVSLNRKCVSTTFSNKLFGASSSYKPQAVVLSPANGSAIGTTPNRGSLNELFDGNVSTYWGVVDGGSWPLRMGWMFSTKKKIERIAVYHNSAHSYIPGAGFSFEVSNDNTNWITQLSSTSSVTPVANQWYIYEITNNVGDFLYHRLNIDSGQWYFGPRCSVAELEMHEKYAPNEITVTFRIGSNNSSTIASFTGDIEEFQLALSALPDNNSGLYNNRSEYNFPGMESTRSLEKKYNRIGSLTLQEETYSIIELTGVVATASNFVAGYEPTKVLDKNSTTYWDSDILPVVSLTLTSSNRYSNIFKYDITLPTGKLTSAPVDWTLEGYTGSTWDVLDTQNNVSWSDGETKTFFLNQSSNIYSAYKLNITDNGGGTSVCIAEVDLWSRNSYTLDTQYPGNVVEKIPIMSAVRGGERHLSSNTGWTKTFDAQGLSSANSLLITPRPSIGQIYIDNTGRPASSGTLVTVSGLSWVVAPTIKDSSDTVVLYRFIGTDNTTSTTVTSSIVLKVNLIANQLNLLSVDLGTTTSTFLSESDIYQVSSDGIDQQPYTDLSNKISNLSINGVNKTLLNGDITKSYHKAKTLSGCFSTSILSNNENYIRTTTVCIGDDLYLLGGELTLNGTKTDRTHRINIKNEVIENLAVCPVAHASAAVMVTYDGSTPIISLWYSNNLYEYNTITDVWSASIPVADNTTQIAVNKFAYCCETVEGKDHIYMYGGVDGSNTPQSQFMDLNITDRILSVITTVTVTPSAVADGLLFDIGTHWLLCGGWNSTGTSKGTYNIENSSTLRLTAGTGGSVLSIRPKLMTGVFTAGDCKLSFSDYVMYNTLNGCYFDEVTFPDGSGFIFGQWGSGYWYKARRTNWVWGPLESAYTSPGQNGQYIQRTGTDINFYVRIANNFYSAGGYTGFTTEAGEWCFRCIAYDAGNTITFISLSRTPIAIPSQYAFTVNGPINETYWEVGECSHPNNLAIMYYINKTTKVTGKFFPTIDPKLGFFRGLHQSGTVNPFVWKTDNSLYRFNDNNASVISLTPVYINELPTIGNYPVITQYKDTDDNTSFICGYGDILNGTANQIFQGGLIADIEITLNDNPVVQALSVSYEYTMLPYSPLQIRVEGFYSSAWHMLDIINEYQVDKSGNTYIIDNNQGLEAIRVFVLQKTLTSGINITSVRLYTDVRFGYAVNNSVDSYLSNTEIICTTTVTSSNQTTLPDTCFYPLGADQTTDQNYVVKSLGLRGIYNQATTNPGAYPYSTRFTTTDYNRVELDIPAVDALDILSWGDVRFAFSFDNRVSWVIYNSGWTSIDVTSESTFRTSGMLAAQVKNIPLSAWTTYTGDGKYVDLTVLLTLADANSNAIFNTLVFISDDATVGGRRIITPLNNWLNVTLYNNAGVYLRDWTAITNSTPTKLVNCYDWTHGTHSSNLVTTNGQDIDISEIFVPESCECMWTYMDPIGSIPIKLQSLLRSSGSILRMSGYIDFFDYSSETLSNLHEDIYIGNTVDYHRRCFGKNGILVFTYGSTGNSTEVFDVATSVLQKQAANMWSVIKGNGATLGSWDQAWLTPGNSNLTTDRWYNNMTLVEYSTYNRYYNQRCAISSLMAKGVGGVSNMLKGWIAGPSLNATYYNINSLDYSNDTAGMTYRSNIDISTLSAGSEVSIGCSSPLNTSGYFLLYRSYPNTDNVRPLVKIRYATDTANQVFRTDTSLVATMSSSPNTQARSMGDYNIYFWSNNADEAGPASVDLATDTVTHRPAGGNTSYTNLGSSYCGAQSIGVNY